MSTAGLVQVLKPDGGWDEKADPRLSAEELRRLHRLMLLVRTADTRALTLQRQGRIGPYVPSIGHEAAHIGSATALEPSDWVFPYYRSQAAAFARGMTLRTYFCQLFGNAEDLAKAHGMPNALGERRINYVSLSAPVSSLLPHAVGFAHAARLRSEKIVTLAYFGEGATSANDFHSGMNFAGVLKAPTVFFCTNNQYAISVPLSRQTASESIAIKAEAYGFEGVRVDGNDILAVHKVTREAVEKARRGGGPTLIEAFTYRLGPHTTVDDPTKYRDSKEVEEWRQRDPISRFKVYLEMRKLWSEADEQKLRLEVEAEVEKAVKEAEALPRPPLQTLFEDVYAEMPWHIKEQLSELLEEKGGSQD